MLLQPRALERGVGNHRDDVEDEQRRGGEAPGEAEGEQHGQDELRAGAEVSRSLGGNKRHLVLVFEEEQRRFPALDLHQARPEENRRYPEAHRQVGDRREVVEAAVRAAEELDHCLSRCEWKSVMTRPATKRAMAASRSMRGSAAAA